MARHFICLFAICIYSLVSCLLKYLIHLLIRLLAFLPMTFKGPLYILVTFIRCAIFFQMFSLNQWIISNQFDCLLQSRFFFLNFNEVIISFMDCLCCYILKSISVCKVIYVVSRGFKVGFAFLNLDRKYTLSGEDCEYPAQIHFFSVLMINCFSLFLSHCIAFVL